MSQVWVQETMCRPSTYLLSVCLGVCCLLSYWCALHSSRCYRNGLLLTFSPTLVFAEALVVETCDMPSLTCCRVPRGSHCASACHASCRQTSSLPAMLCRHSTAPVCTLDLMLLCRSHRQARTMRVLVLHR